MLPFLAGTAVLVVSVLAQSSAPPATTSSSTGSKHPLEGGQGSVINSTNSTHPGGLLTKLNFSAFLNASIHAGEIDLTVNDLTAKCNLGLEALSMLSFNAGVRLATSEVHLLMLDIRAQLSLHAQPGELTSMLDDILSAIDNNPILDAVGKGVVAIDDSLGDTVQGLAGSPAGPTGGSTSSLAGASSTAPSATASPASAVAKRSFDLSRNILYSISDYIGSTHTERIFAQNGDIVDKHLDKDGQAQSQRIVGTFARDMHPLGKPQVVERQGEVVQETEWRYHPHGGIDVTSLVFTDDRGSVVGTQVLAQSSAGGRSSVSEDL